MDTATPSWYDIPDEIGKFCHWLYDASYLQSPEDIFHFLEDPADWDKTDAREEYEAELDGISLDD